MVGKADVYLHARWAASTRARWRGIGRGSPALVLLAARVAETTVERILSPGVVEAGKCAACGRSG
ncbi:hypothetical protein BE20_18175 [Sorangium cellulosum]|nr:hypothetical protein BE20_18175 [Sorangium cellulosum]